MKSIVNLPFFQPKLTPLLLIGYNRPDLMKNLINSLPQDLRSIYISVDGPRRVSDKVAVEDTLKIANLFASSRNNVKVRHFEENLGCKEHVTSAIDWIFENELMAIILEDDISFNHDFFHTMDLWLQVYQKDKSIFHLNGYTPVFGKLEKDEVYLSKYSFVWGWATWRDRWLMYDRNLSTYSPSEFRNLPGLSNQKLTSEFEKYWIELLDLCRGGFNSWCIQWQYSQWAAGMYSVTPGKRMTGNLGFDNRATHTSSDIHPGRKITPGETCFANGSQPKPRHVQRLDDFYVRIEHGILGDPFVIKSLKWIKHRLYLLKNRFVSRYI